MSKNDIQYVQVQLYRTEGEYCYSYVTWLPLKYAIKEKTLSIKVKDKWEHWIVGTVYSESKIPESNLVEGERDYLKQRKVSDRIRKA